jgi:GrpB-like predicted nucleotidyltransferase (UPF0157 family)
LEGAPSRPGFSRSLNFSRLQLEAEPAKNLNFVTMLIHPYHPDWPEHFAQIASILNEAVGDHLVAIHHIGSTAVPGLAAKPIVDIDMEYPVGGALAPITSALEKLGYYHNGDQGIPGREVFKRESGTSAYPVLDAIPHHLYLCASDNEELSRHLRFRDGLRSDKAARTAYEQIKREVAALAGEERKAYAEVKEKRARDLVESVLRGCLRK